MAYLGSICEEMLKKIMKITKSGSLSMIQDAMTDYTHRNKMSTDQPRCRVQCVLRIVYNKPETHVWQNARPEPGLLPEMYNTDSQNLFLFSDSIQLLLHNIKSCMGHLPLEYPIFFFRSFYSGKAEGR